MIDRWEVSAPEEGKEMTKEQAKREFAALVARYGLQWRADVPREAWDQLAEINKVLDERDRREAIGLRP